MTNLEKLNERNNIDLLKNIVNIAKEYEENIKRKNDAKTREAFREYSEKIRNLEEVFKEKFRLLTVVVIRIDNIIYILSENNHVLRIPIDDIPNMKDIV